MNFVIAHDNWPKWFIDWAEAEIKKNNGRPIKIKSQRIKVGQATRIGQALANKMDNDILRYV